MRNKYLYLVLAIIILAFSLRVAYLLQTKDNPLFYPGDNGLDPSLYHQRAQLILQQTDKTPPLDPSLKRNSKVYPLGLKEVGGSIPVDKLPLDFVYGMPGYPYFLAAIYKIFGQDFVLVRLIQVLLGVLNCLLIYFISKQLFNHRAAIVALFLSATYGMFIFYEGMLLGASLGLLLNSLIILLLLSIQKKTNYRKWLLLGILIGLASLIRANILVFLPFIIGWFILLKNHTLKRRIISQLIFCLSVVFVIAPITLRNYKISGEFIPLTAHGGINFYIGNNPDADGTFKPPLGMHISLGGLIADSISQAQEKSNKTLTPSEVSRFWFGRSRSFIQKQPGKFAKLLFRKIILLFNSYEISDIVNYSFFRRNFSTVLSFPWPNLRVILPLGLLGIALSFSNWRKYLLFYFFMLSFIISAVAYFVHARYRLPLAPVLIIFAGFALDRCVFFIQQKNFKGFFLSLVALGLLYGATSTKIVWQNEISQYNNLGVSYKQSGMFDLAIEAYKEALKINPNQAQTRNNLGNLYSQQKRYLLAIDELKEAVRIDPNLAEAHANLGIVYVELEKLNEATREYKLAIALRPNLVKTHYNLAVLYHQMGKTELASQELKTVLRLAPNHAVAWSNLGAIYFEQGLYDEAREYWEEALRLDPNLKGTRKNLNILQELNK